MELLGCSGKCCSMRHVSSLKDSCKLLEHGMLVVVNLCKGCSWHWVEKCMGQCFGGEHGGIDGGHAGHGDFGWKQFNSIGNSSVACFGAVHNVAAVVFNGWANVPAINAIWGPGFVDSLH
jgi:hypothetical protein